MLQCACCQASIHEARESDDLPPIPCFTIGNVGCLDLHPSRGAFFCCPEGEYSHEHPKYRTRPPDAGGHHH